MTPSARAQVAPQTPNEAAEAARVEPGRGVFLRDLDSRLERASQPLPGGPFSVVFRDAPIASVVNQVLGEQLGVDYALAPDVSGQVTLRLQDIATRGEALQALRDALSPLSISLLDRGDFIAVVRGGGAQTGATVVLVAGEPAPPGAGVAMITLGSAHPGDVRTLLEALTSEVEIVLADDVRRVFVVRGEAAALTAASRAAALLDVAWIEEISTAVFPVRAALASDLADDLGPLLGPYRDTIELIALDRVNALAVLSARPEGLALVERWLAELDQPRRSVINPRQLVYTVRHADPIELVTAIRQVLGYGGPGGMGGMGGAAGGLGGSMATGGGRGVAGVQAGAEGLLVNPTQLQISAAPSQNMILARGAEDRIAEVRELVELLDQPRAQVAIEAAIISVSLQDEFRFGVNWFGAPSEQVALRFADNPEGDIASVFPGLSATYLNMDIEGALNLLDSITEIEVISRPNVMALHNQQAELQVGDQVPIVTQSAVSVTDPDAPIVNQTAYRDTGVILSVTPHVRAGGVVEIDITQEVSSVVQTTSSGIDSPTIRQRRITSTLLVPSGQSVALGGLIASTRSTGQTGVPVLRTLPGVGRLFGSETESVDRTELVVLLTPVVIVDPSRTRDAWLQLPPALERLRRRLEADR